jgi:hypothetical protein
MSACKRALVDSQAFGVGIISCANRLTIFLPVNKVVESDRSLRADMPACFAYSVEHERNRGRIMAFWKEQVSQQHSRLSF